MDTAEILEAFYTEHAPELLQGRRGVGGALTALRRKATAKGLSGNQVDDFVFSTVASRHGAIQSYNWDVPMMVYIWIRYTGTIMYRIDLVDHTSSTGTVRPRAAGCRRDCFFNTPYDLWPWGPHSTASVRRVMLSATTRGHAGQRREHCLQHRCPPPPPIHSS